MEMNLKRYPNYADFNFEYFKTQNNPKALQVSFEQ